MRQPFIIVFCCSFFASHAMAENTTLDISTQIIKDLAERLKAMQAENLALQQRNDALAHQLVELKGQPIGAAMPAQRVSASNGKGDLGYDFSINFEQPAQPEKLSDDLDAALSLVEEKLRGFREKLNRPVRRTSD